MNGIEHLVDQIPIKHNLVSSMMLIGIVQGLFVTLVIFARSKKNYAIQYLGWSFLCSTIVFFDTYLCYTGLIKNLLFLNDSTEFLVLLIFPFVYFSIYGLIKRAPITVREHWWHFMLPTFYFFSQIPFFLAPLAVKYNAYLGAYFSDLQTVTVPQSHNYSYHFFKDIFDWLILFSILFYALMSLKLVWDERKKNKSNKSKSGKYLFTRNSAFVLLLLLIFVFTVFYLYDDDGGDHYIVIFNAVITFSTSYLIMSESRFFKKSWVADKYETLGNAKSDLSFEEIQNYVDRKNYFLTKEASLINLASFLEVHPNQISKIVNLENASNFNDYINQKRVKAATVRLADQKYAHLTIEAIGNSVGFKSKSAFYNAFKKHTGTSPSAYVKQVSPKL